MKRLLATLAILPLLLLPGVALSSGTLGVDTFVSANVPLTLNPTMSMTVGSSATGLLVMVMSQSDTPTAATWNGTTMTAVATFNDVANSGYFHRAWYLPSPASGTHNVQISIPATSNPVFISAWSLTGSQTSTTADASQSGSCTSNCASKTISITTVDPTAWVFAQWGQNVGAGTFSFPGSVAASGRVTTSFGVADSNGAVSTGAHNVVGAYTSNNRINGLAVSIAAGPAAATPFDFGIFFAF